MNKNINKEEILKLALGVDNSLFRLYINLLDDSSTNYILAAIALIKDGGINEKIIDEAKRKKQIKIATMLLEEAINIAGNAYNDADKFKKIELKNDLKKAYSYLIAIYGQDSDLNEEILPLKEYTKDANLESKARYQKYISEGYKYLSFIDVLYILNIYNGQITRYNVEKIADAIKYLDLKEKVNIDKVSDQLSIIAGELITNDKDLEDSLKLCDFIINNDINNEKAYYFKAYINKDKEDFDNLISTYKQICVYKHIELLDPLEIIE